MADYPGLARMISSHREAAIFRRFDALNLKSLLYMQAEILHLEAELEGFEIDDKSATDSNRARLVKSVHDLRKSAGKGIGSQGSVIQEIRTKLQEYNGALLQYLLLCKVAEPTPNDVECLREWLQRSDGGQSFLIGRERETWKTNSKFLSLDPQQAEKDKLTHFLSEKVVPWFYHRWGHRVKPSSSAEGDGIWEYEKRKLDKIANGISTILASLMPCIPIIILYFLSTPVTRLVAIILISLVFSIIMTAVSNARRAEVFAAATALAAVQVVFVSGGFGTS